MEEHYSLDRMHEPKSLGERRNGKTVDAIVDVIGKLMVTENETIPFVLANFHRADFTMRMFIDICVKHFKLTPIIKDRYNWQIEGYSSRVKIFSETQGYEPLRGYSIEPTLDL